MKKTLFLIVLVWLSGACTKGDKDLKIQILPFIQENYSEDAKQLYVQEVASDSTHPGYNNPELNAEEIQQILLLFQAVYNCPDPEAHEVFDHSIHVQIKLSLHAVNLKVDTANPAIAQLAAGDIPTGNKDLDPLLTEYHFDSVRLSASYPGFPWLTLYTAFEYNMLPIQKQLLEMPFIMQAGTEMMLNLGEGNDIRLDRHQEEADMTFITGWGDCLTGCIHHHYWEFHIENSKAELISSYED